MYHVIGTPLAGTANAGLWVAGADFRAQVRSLAAGGYEGVTLAQIRAAWQDRAGLPRHPVVLTFDDGYVSDATVAAPVLRAAGWPGVLNLEIRNAGPDGIPVHLIRRMIRDGWEVDSHTVDHPDLTTLAPGRLAHELVRSRAWIRRTLGVPADFLCYPAGRYDARVIAAVRSAGYRGATTERPGRATAGGNPYELPRIRVAGGETAAQLLAAVGG
jgi:peptidoglycan/xylan/chitin deacetylase (PgdA/CDA1 family)